jgi:glyoxylase-like metal-dependent hydrolase (beta-lactamase superfamily II)
MFRELIRLSENTWVFPHDENPNTVQPNIGLIKTAKQTVLVDAGNSPRHARQVMAEMVGMDFPVIDTVIYTHSHWDHTFGAMTFNPRTVVSHELCDTHLRQQATRQWGTMQLREEMYRNPSLETRNNAMNQAMGDWRDFRIVLPTITFVTKISLYYEPNITLELEYVGGTHSEDALIVRLPQEGVVFMGDCGYPPSATDRKPNTAYHFDITLLQQIISPQYNVYIQGHHPPMSYQDMQALLQQGGMA